MVTSGHYFEAKVLVDSWKTEYNAVRLHSSLNYQPPTPETIKSEWIENLATLLRAGTTYRRRSITAISLNELKSTEENLQ